MGNLCTVQGACSYWKHTAIEQGSKILTPLNTVCTSDYNIMLMYIPIRGSSTKDKTIRMKLRASQSYEERQWQKGS